MLIALVIYTVVTKGKLKRDKFLIAILSITILFQAYKIFPYTGLSKFEVLDAEKQDEENYLSMVHCNVLQTNRNFKKCIEEVTRNNPDVILFVETDEWWKNVLSPLEKEYPYTAFCPLPNTYGMLVYSKLKMENTDFKYLVEKDVPSLNPIITLRSGVKLNCYFIHPKPPSPRKHPVQKQGMQSL